MGLTLIRRDLVSLLGASVIDRGFYNGSVFADGKLLPDWMAIHPRKRIIIRGTRQAKYRSCEVCGRDLYSALERDNLCPPPPAGTLSSTNATGGRLVVAGELMESLDAAQWKLERQRLDVLDVPRDGLPRDLRP